ncbi:hypothetical protein [Nonomuraea sp. KM88]|uniref:hypothetical protein n=1 Tax=Nonomuraea sp. KM88 TaxID=3457427 RepID=UPI003FCD9BFD
MKRIHLLLSALAAAVLLLAASAAPAAATAETPAPSGQYCVMVIGKAPPGKASPVRSHECADDYATASRKAGASDTVLLMEWFWNANNSPSNLTRIHGDYGNCDADGYHINILDHWANNISGFNSYSRCNVVTGYNFTLWEGDRQTWSMNKPCQCLLQGWVGSYMNDRIESFWIRQG